MNAPSTTHDLTFDGDRVVKRFTSWERGEHIREWRGISLLARHSPGLAPEPLAAWLDGDPPTIAMSRLPAEPVGSTPLTDTQIDALADALLRMHASVPEDEPAGVEHAFDATVRTAYEAAAQFAILPWAQEALAIGGVTRPVFGQVGGNLANFLWDGSTVRIVDFEDSGSSDPMFELATLLEHISVVHGAGLDAERLLARFDLTAAERARLHLFRRGFAVYWLLRLLPGGSSHRRNPPGTLEAQAARLLASA